MNDFFIGWEAKPPKPLSRFTRLMAAIAVGTSLLIGLGAAAWQGTIGEGTWNLNVREFTGVFLDSPTPLLLAEDAQGRLLPYLLVGERKFGLPAEKARALHLRRVRLKGTLLQDDQVSMIEVADVVESRGEAAGDPLGAWKDLGAITLRGEIVDSKCYLGAMNPGTGKPHRACAIHCIRGGIPPVLISHDAAGQTSFCLLLGPNGEAVNQEVLDFVAEPVAITGSLRQAGPVSVLQFDPATIDRL